MDPTSESFKDICIMICAGLSVMGCLLIIISGTFYKKLQTYSFRLVMYLSLADLLSSVCIFLFRFFTFR